MSQRLPTPVTAAGEHRRGTMSTSALALALALVAFLALAVTLAVHALALRKLAGERRRRPLADRRLPPISVLRPLKGLDDGFAENLAALARQGYPRFELICGAEDPGDPALEVARRVAAAHPDVAIRVVAGAAPFGLNPKVTNLATLARHARHEHLLISDSNACPRTGYLRAMAETMAGGDGRRPAGLVSSVLAGRDLAAALAPSPGALCEDLHLGTFVAAAVCAADVAGAPCVVGKSMLFRRADLDAVGGWAAVADVLAEDYAIGRAFAAAGHRVALSAEVVPVVAGRRRVADFLARHLRWSQMRCRIAPFAYAGEVLLNPVPALAATAALTAAAGTTSLAVAAVAGVAAKVAADGLLLARLSGRPVPLSRLAWIPLKDLLIAAVWLAAPWKTTVVWRGERLRIGAGSRLAPLGDGHRWTGGAADGRWAGAEEAR